MLMVIYEVSNSNTSKADWLYGQKAWRSMFYYITQSSLAWHWIYLLTFIKTSSDNLFINHKASFDNNIIFITFMVEIYYIYGEPDYHIHGWNFITFMVRNFITFMLDFYHFYVGYYIYGWLLLHLWLIIKWCFYARYRHSPPRSCS